MAAAATPATRPNVLFILTEDQGAHLRLIGTPGLQTPNMDRLARSGVYFNNAFVTYAVCSASKAAIYTGLHNHTNGLMNNTPNFPKPAEQFTDSEVNTRPSLRGSGSWNRRKERGKPRGMDPPAIQESALSALLEEPRAARRADLDRTAA